LTVATTKATGYATQASRAYKRTIGIVSRAGAALTVRTIAGVTHAPSA
jgi:hypothetical protein